MEARLLWASLWRQRGTATLAALAVAIGASVAAALMHVSGDVGAKLTRELRSLGPNLLLTSSEPAVHPFLSQPLAEARMRSAGLDGVCVLYASALARGHAIPVAGANLPALLVLHPSWKRGAGATDVLAGVSLARRLDLRAGDTLTLQRPDGTHPVRVALGAVFEAGDSEDDALWLALPIVQALAGREAEVSLVQARVGGGLAAVERMAVRLENGGGIAALPLHALSATEQGLLDRMRRLMLLVTLAALVAGALSAYGTLTDLALERRREIAVLKAIGAPRRRIIGRFLIEAMAIGLAGGVVGWGVGAAFALFIGRQVFHATLRLQPGVPSVVIPLAVLTALVATAGPIRLALAIEPARALREDG